MHRTIDYFQLAEKQLDRLDSEVAERIRRFMRERVAPKDFPRVLAKRLTGPFEGKFRYRVGDYRVVCTIEDEKLLVQVVEVAHRREVYRP